MSRTRYRLVPSFYQRRIPAVFNSEAFVGCLVRSVCEGSDYCSCKEEWKEAFHTNLLKFVDVLGNARDRAQASCPSAFGGPAESHGPQLSFEQCEATKLDQELMKLDEERWTREEDSFRCCLFETRLDADLSCNGKFWNGGYSGQFSNSLRCRQRRDLAAGSFRALLFCDNVLMTASVCSSALDLNSCRTESNWVKKEDGCEKKCGPEAEVRLHLKPPLLFLHLKRQTGRVFFQ
jgi:hypothetical protein